MHSPKVRAVIQAFFVTFLWSSSWVLIKFGLHDIPALTFAGLRYFLAFLCLLALALRTRSRVVFATMAGRHWRQLAYFGLIQITLTQGAQFVSLAYLSPATVSLILSFTPALVAVMGAAWLGERVGALRCAGIAIFLCGAVVYLWPVDSRGSPNVAMGLAASAVALLANAGQTLYGRAINRPGAVSSLLITTVSMGFGSVTLLMAGLGIQGMSRLELKDWMFVCWLAVVNTAVAFTLWNQALRFLRAVEASLINNSMLIEIAALAYVFLGEQLTLAQIVGIAVASIGILTAQIAGARSM
jgi:drug/metabolite transporter (DMT)-like permease